jgi:hypothetical protein
MQLDVAAEWGDWDVDGNDFGGHIVRHRHWDGLKLAYVYPDSKDQWAECSDCGATITMRDSDQWRGNAAPLAEGDEKLGGTWAASES